MKLLFALLVCLVCVARACDEMCTNEYNPVCASNGMTFSNKCVFDREVCLSKSPVTLAHEGACEEFPCPEACTANVEPVCNSATGMEFSNFCEFVRYKCLNKVELPAPTLGACPKVELPCSVDLCPMNFEPVCGNDGQTYSNLCMLRRKACLTKSEISVSHDGECTDEDCEGMMCTEEYAPVCGTDGETSSNACALRRKACLAKTDISILHTGECTEEDAPCAGVCTANYEPVCGSDGNTYPNLCMLQQLACRTKSGVTVSHDGECATAEIPCPQVCPLIYSPVCGTNGITYSNACLLRAKACLAKSEISVAHDGECTDDDCHSMACTKEYRPICGSDGHTYSNGCMMNRQSCLTKSEITVAHEGECTVADEPCTNFCPMHYEPVCGSDSQTYSNLCMLTQKACLSKTQISVAHDGECTEADCNSRACPTIYSPVCGSDGETSSNLCVFQVKACLAKSALTILHDGECTEEDAPCSGICTKEYKPVCGTDRRTYSNLCMLQQFACKTKATTLEVIHEGECTEDDCKKGCTRELRPVCGSDGNTYSNLCLLQQQSCTTKADLTVAYEGKCIPAEVPCDIACTKEYKPVCGSNGRTYSNLCGLQVAACNLKADISIAHEGECTEEDCSNIACTLEYTPICGSDGNTYSNLCNLNVQACASKTEISVSHDGECAPACNMRCSKEYIPVCGSDFNSYDNECLMTLAACEKKATITKLHDGACDGAEAASDAAQSDNNNNNNNNNNGASEVAPLSGAAIAGIVASVIGVVAVAAIVAIVAMRKKQAGVAVYSNLESSSDSHLDETPYTPM